MTQTILIVDDEKNIRDSLAMILEAEGYEVLTAGSGEVALDMVRQHVPELVILDVGLPKMDGLAVLGQIKSQNPSIEIVMISGHADVPTAVKAVREGAYDFLEKPLTKDKFIVVVKRALEKQRLAGDLVSLKPRVDGQEALVGSSPPMQRLKALVAKVAPTKSPVLVTGESGTGKELVVRALHALSPRHDGPLVQVNCAAVPHELIESELFGHEAGAFTGAKQKRVGKFEQAHHGTLVLDEIGDMPLPMQAKLLRVLQEQTFERVGGNYQVKVDVRVVAATNKILEEEIKKGAFREDVFFRINTIPIYLPPLRERADDVPELVAHFLEGVAREQGVKKTVSPDALAMLKQYAWPGNVRELKNAVERMAILSQGTVIATEDLEGVLPRQDENLQWAGQSLQEVMETTERKWIMEALEQHQGNVTRAAESLGIERTNLHKKINRFGLKASS